MLTAVIGRPAMLIRRLPNKLIRMGADYVVYDVQERGTGMLPDGKEWMAIQKPSTWLRSRHAGLVPMQSRCWDLVGRDGDGRAAAIEKRPSRE